MKGTDLTNKRFGRLTALSFSRKIISNTSRRFWLCRCDCDNLVEIGARSLVSGNTKSCGCLKIAKLMTHGMTYSKEYRVWWGILQRCYNKKNARYYRYGNRGITVCQEWRESFRRFYLDMGDIPQKGLSLDRINNDGNYCRSNCRWATRSQQQRNKS